MTDLIEKRDERTRKRKQTKRKMDSIIGLSYHDDEKKVLSVSTDVKKLSDTKARLLDEGYIDNGFVIKKGTLEKYLNGQNQYVRGWEYDGEHWSQTEVLNLTPDFEGHVNLGHMDFSIMPFVLGTWKKEDLTLVDTENDRKALDVTLHLDEDSVFIQELRRQPFDIGISAEFWVHENVEDTEALSETLGYYLPVFDEIYIFAYGLVGECGNVNSSGLELKGEVMDKDKMNLAEEVTEEVTEPEEIEEEELSVEEVEEVSEESESEEESEEELDEAEADETGLDEVLEEIESLRSENAELKEQVESLTEANAELKKTNKRLNKKLSAEKEKKEAFIKNAKGISVKLGINEEKTDNSAEVDADYIKRG